MLKHSQKIWFSISQKVKDALPFLDKKNNGAFIPISSHPCDPAPFLIDYSFLYPKLNQQQRNLTRLGWILKCIGFGEGLIESSNPYEKKVETHLSDGRTITRFYDGFGRLKKISFPDKTELIHEYDDRGNLSAIFTPNGSIRYSYSLLDQLIKIKSFGGKEISCIWDPARNVKSIIYSNGEKTDYSWDANNRLAGVTDSFAAIEYQRDKLGNLSGVIYPDGIKYSFNLDNKTKDFSLKYSYTSENKISAIISPFGISRFDNSGSIASRIDANGQKVLFHYDQNKRLKYIEGPLGITAFDYDNTGRLVAITDPWGLKTVLKYNSRGQLEETIDNFGAGRCEYDKSGKLHKITREKKTKFVFKYNLKGRVKSINTPLGTVKYNKKGREDLHIIFPGNPKVDLQYNNNVLEKISIPERMQFLNLAPFWEILFLPQLQK